MEFEFKVESNFLDKDSCNKIIDYYHDKLTSSEVIGNSKLRTSEDFYIDLDTIDDSDIKQIVLNIKQKISDISNLPIENQELLTLIKYNPGQEFKPHFDAFPDDDEFFVESVLGGQRLQTFIICLQQCELGGETSFDNIQKSLTLEPGECIYWQNVDEEFKILKDSLHSGRPPIKGEKWILTCWIRQNKYYALDRNITKQIITNYSEEFLINILKQL